MKSVLIRPAPFYGGNLCLPAFGAGLFFSLFAASGCAMLMKLKTLLFEQYF